MFTAACLVNSAALVLLRTYDQSQLPLPYRGGRMPAQKRLMDVYPDCPKPILQMRATRFIVAWS